MRRANILIQGQVQGVCYRAHAAEMGQRLHLHGYVRNVSNGDVRAIVEGDDEAVSAFVAWCYEGSPQAYVEEVRVTDEAYVGDLEPFAIR